MLQLQLEEEKKYSADLKGQVEELINKTMKMQAELEESKSQLRETILNDNH